MTRLLSVAALAALSGCAALPNSVSPEFEHVSHLGQHFESCPTHYGIDVVSVTAEWDVGKHVYVTLAEGINLDRQYHYVDGEIATGAMAGGRETFTGRVGYKFVVKP